MDDDDGAYDKSPWRSIVTKMAAMIKKAESGKPKATIISIDSHVVPYLPILIPKVQLDT
jgi:hypothetical protein